MSKKEDSEEDCVLEESVSEPDGETSSLTRSSASSIRGTALCLTYPRALISKKDLFTNLLSKLDPKELIVVCEKHVDGTPHLHAYIHFGRRRYIKHKLLDECGGKHGNYKITYDKYGWMKYLNKEDEAPLCHGTDRFLAVLHLCYPKYTDAYHDASFCF